MKKLRSIQRSAGQHWVGNGFPVRTLFAYPNLGPVLSPFLLLDYAGPATFEPTSQRRGVGAHPHRGFETVTIVYDGEVEHRDSTGGGGIIGPGDVQWMTAASGIVHEEFHGREYARRGGPFEMVQLWVNLPARDKKAPPGYQGILDSQIPSVTFTPMQVADLRLSGDERSELVVRDGWTTALVVLRGELRVNGAEPIRAAEVGLFDRHGSLIRVDAAADARALLLCGDPIDEPIFGTGPFVMNHPREIQQAIDDYESGRMGRLA
jgi:redox-sensitive bicupin YhaK (pirin superfamily)